MAKKNTHSHLPDESQKRESTNAHSEPNAKSIVHETMQRAHLQIEFFTCELAGVQSTVRVHPRAGLLDQVLEASSDHHRSRREAEKSACAHLLPKLREHLPEYIRATHRHAKDIIREHANPSRQHSRVYMRGHIAFAESVSDGSLPLSALTSSDRSLANTARREYLASSSSSACSEQLMLQHLRLLAAEESWMASEGWRINLRSVAGGGSTTVDGPAWNDFIQEDIAKAAAHIEAQAEENVRAVVLPADPNEHAYDVEVEVNNKHPYEAFAYHLEASSSTPTCIHRKYSSSEEALFAFLPLREDLDELRDNPRIAFLIGEAAKGPAVIAQARMSFEEPGRLKHAAFSTSDLESVFEKLMPSSEYTRGNSLAKLPYCFSFWTWRWFSCRHPVRLLKQSVNLLTHRLPKLHQPQEHVFKSVEDGSIKTGSLDLGGGRVSRCTLGSSPSSKAGAALVALHALEKEVKAQLAGHEYDVSELWSKSTIAAANEIEKHAAVCPRLVTLERVSGGLLPYGRGAPMSFTTQVGVQSLAYEIENAIQQSHAWIKGEGHGTYKGWEWSPPWKEAPPLWENRVPEIFEPSLDDQRIRVSLNAISGAKSILCLGYTPLSLIDEYIKPEKVIIVDPSAEEIKRSARGVQGTYEQKAKIGEQMFEVLSYQGSILNAGLYFTNISYDAILISAAFDRFSDTQGKCALESYLSIVKPKVLAVTNFNIAYCDTIARKHKELLNLEEEPPAHAVADNNSLRWDENTFRENMNRLADDNGYTVCVTTFGETEDPYTPTGVHAAACAKFEHTSFNEAMTQDPTMASDAGLNLLVWWKGGETSFTINRVFDIASANTQKKRKHDDTAYDTLLASAHDPGEGKRNAAR